MSLLRTYLRHRRRLLAALALMLAIFAGTFALYGLPLRAVAYPAALCAALGLGLLVWDFRRVQARHRLLTAIRSAADLRGQRLPPPDSITERDYQQLLQLLCEEQARLRSDTGRRYTDMVDYYTTWAHQIKTPIASMELTLQNEDSPLSRRLSAELLRIEQYVEMVLVFLRLDSDTRDLVIREQPLDPMIRQAVRKFAGEFISRKLRLCYEPAEVRVLTDEKWLSFVIEQLLSNALKYTPAGSITITVEPPLTLCIRDTGMGIAPEDLPRVFEKGYTGYHGRADKKASGIGLYLCKRVCADLGHEISITSQPDVGTTVRLDLSRRNLEVE